MARDAISKTTLESFVSRLEAVASELDSWATAQDKLSRDEAYDSDAARDAIGNAIDSINDLINFEPEDEEEVEEEEEEEDEEG